MIEESRDLRNVETEDGLNKYKADFIANNIKLLKEINEKIMTDLTEEYNILRSSVQSSQNSTKMDMIQQKVNLLQGEQYEINLKFFKKPLRKPIFGKQSQAVKINIDTDYNEVKNLLYNKLDSLYNEITELQHEQEETQNLLIQYTTDNESENLRHAQMSDTAIHYRIQDRLKRWHLFYDILQKDIPTEKDQIKLLNLLGIAMKKKEIEILNAQYTKLTLLYNTTEGRTQKEQIQQNINIITQEINNKQQELLQSQLPRRRKGIFSQQKQQTSPQPQKRKFPIFPKQESNIEGTRRRHLIFPPQETILKQEKPINLIFTENNKKIPEEPTTRPRHKIFEEYKPSNNRQERQNEIKVAEEEEERQKRKNAQALMALAQEKIKESPIKLIEEGYNENNREIPQERKINTDIYNKSIPSEILNKERHISPEKPPQNINFKQNINFNYISPNNSPNNYLTKREYEQREYEQREYEQREYEQINQSVRKGINLTISRKNIGRNNMNR